MHGVGPALDEEAREARPAHDRRPARPPAAPLRGGRRRGARSPICSRARKRSRSPARSSARPCAGRGARLAIVQARIADESGEITAVWFNQVWLADKLKPGHARAPPRPAQPERVHRSLLRPERRLRDRRLRAGVPRERGGHRQEAARARRQGARARARPARLRCPRRLAAARRACPLRADALTALHRPRDAGRGRAGPPPARVRRAARAPGRASRARRRGRERRARTGARRAGRARRALPDAASVRAHPHQERAIAEIDADLARPTPMERLLQGEVGSGKTVVALYALLRAVEAGKKGALMAPTETLAEQHFLTLEEPCRELGVEVALLTRSVKDDPCAGADPRRHARADPGGRRPERRRSRRRRRAAPVRSRAAAGDHGRPSAARPAHDRDADPAHARAHRLRRPLRQRDREAARRTASRSRRPG